MMEQMFSISFFHSYFRDGIYENCQLVPDAKTRLIVERFNLLLRRRRGNYGLYGNFQDGVDRFLPYLASVLSDAVLRFYVVTDEAKFFGMTELPSNWIGQLQWSTQNASSASINGKQFQAAESHYGDKVIEKSGVIGVLSIDINDVIGVGAPNANYAIAFKSKSLHWMYYIVNSGETALKNPVIKNKSGQVFERPVTTTLPGGQVALCFSSGEMQFPLSQEPQQLFDLIDSLPMRGEDESATSTFIERNLIQGLPTPQVGQSGVQQKAGKPYFFSAMYVYV